MNLILLDVLTPFVHMVKFKFLEQFPVDHLAHPEVSSLMLFLRQFATFPFLGDWSFYLYHHDPYICYFFTSYLFLLLHI